MDDREGSIDQEMEQKMVDEDSMDDNEPEKDLSIDVRGKKYATGSKQKLDLLFENGEKPIKNSRSQKPKSKILSETTGRQKWHQKNISIEDAQISFFKCVEQEMRKSHKETLPKKWKKVKEKVGMIISENT